MMVCRCYRCERQITGAGRWVSVKVGKITTQVFVCLDCAKVME